MMETTSTTPERSPPSQQSTPPQAQPTHITNSEDTNKTQVKSNGHATRLAKDAVTTAGAAQGGAGEESTSVRMRHKPRLHAHRATMELEPEEDMDDSYIDPNYGIKPQPYKFGQKLSVKLPWKKEKTRDTGSDPPSCSSSVSSVEGVGGETWTKTGSLPALFRKRSLSLTFYFVIPYSFYHFKFSILMRFRRIVVEYTLEIFRMHQFLSLIGGD